jgi:hypothetical protein
MQRTKLASKSVASAGYDDASSTLEIEFTSGRVYQFDAVPRGVYDWLLRTTNKGSFVARMINDRYAYRDLTQRPADSQDQPDLLQALQDSLRKLHAENSDKTDKR